MSHYASRFDDLLYLSFLSGMEHALDCIEEKQVPNMWLNRAAFVDWRKGMLPAPENDGWTEEALQRLRDGLKKETSVDWGAEEKYELQTIVDHLVEEKAEPGLSSVGEVLALPEEELEKTPAVSATPCDCPVADDDSVSHYLSCNIWQTINRAGK